MVINYLKNLSIENLQAQLIIKLLLELLVEEVVLLGVLLVKPVEI
jgi:hypothetical protein